MQRNAIVNRVIAVVITLTLTILVGYVTHVLNILLPIVHRPVYIPGTVQVAAYRIVPYQDLSLVQTKHYRYVATEEPNGPKRYAFGPQLVPYYWISNGPTVCNNVLASRLDKLLRDYNSYGLAPDKNDMYSFIPDYAFKVTGASGFLIVVVQSKDGIFAVNKYKNGGVFEETSGEVKCQGKWDSILKRASP